ncbi:hypothetical protein NC653_022151 [Populus alba x Populus x berolinensis]|uniref:Uncharacterized protein n=1 Tax=Populus alba x Populus x berolinensis TaxID=444605 RepID=A0AAD6VU88_9ROSI|nr:hypothetical protein NC653_022151 [Populus alba x Populus x berolinensis]
MFNILFFNESDFGLPPIICLEHLLSKYHLSFFLYKKKIIAFDFCTYNPMVPLWLVNVSFGTQINFFS